MNRPLVTVVTPAFNAVDCIADCVASVRAQDHPAIEHLIIDGGSSDGTRERLQDLGMAHVSEPDAGIYDAMSKGVRAARGDYVHILNADDRYSASDALSAVIAEMETRQLDLCHAQARQIGRDGEVVRTFGRDIGFAALRAKMRVAHPTVVVRRAVYERYGTFSVGFRIAADLEFLLRVWQKIRIGFIPRPLVDMRLGGVSTDNANVARSYREAMAAALLHGANPLLAAGRCYYEIAKHTVFFSRRFRT